MLISKEHQPNPANQFRGRVNKAQGNFFEELIDRSCEHYRQDGTAVIEKTPEPFHITRSLGGGKFQGNFAKAAQPDYKGVLHGGRMIAIEAKLTSSDRIEQDRVTAEQAEALEEYQAAGALCFVMVSLQMQRFFLVPWQAWKEIRQRFGRNYIRAEELSPYERRFNGRWIELFNRKTAVPNGTAVRGREVL